MSQFYSDPSRETDPYALPDVEIFYQVAQDDEDKFDGPGWYFWFCSPGCLPDSDPFGPYESETDAQNAARRYVGTED